MRITRAMIGKWLTYSHPQVETSLNALVVDILDDMKKVEVYCYDRNKVLVFTTLTDMSGKEDGHLVLQRRTKNDKNKSNTSKEPVDTAPGGGVSGAAEDS